jgi:hypothetical protein
VSGLLRFGGAVKRDPAIATWLEAQPGELRALATPWFARMRRCGSDIRELMHDGLATACLGCRQIHPTREAEARTCRRRIGARDAHHRRLRRRGNEIDVRQ